MLSFLSLSEWPWASQLTSLRRDGNMPLLGFLGRWKEVMSKSLCHAWASQTLNAVKSLLNLWLFICWVTSDCDSNGLKNIRLPCPLLSSGVCSNSCPFSQWCYLKISSSVTFFSSCPLSFPTSGSFPVSQLFTSGGQSIGASASASIPPMNIQDWFPLGLTGLISLQSKGLCCSPGLTLKSAYFSWHLSPPCLLLSNTYFLRLSYVPVDQGRHWGASWEWDTGVVDLACAELSLSVASSMANSFSSFPSQGPLPTASVLLMRRPRMIIITRSSRRWTGGTEGG